MSLSGLQIYKLLPQTNCKDCGFPTCLAFAMKLGAKQVELAACPHVSEEAQAQLASAAEPPVRLITLQSNGFSVNAGNETVLFRHEKKFFNKPGFFVRIKDDQPAEEIEAIAQALHDYTVDYVGIDLTFDGVAVESVSGNPATFTQAIGHVRHVNHLPMILISDDPAVMAAGLQAVDGEKALIHSADATNWEAMTNLAKQHQMPMSVTASSLDELADLTTQIKEAGVADLVLHPQADNLIDHLTMNTQIRRLAIKENFRPLGYPIISIPTQGMETEREIMLAAQAIAKYAGFIVLDYFSPAVAYPLLVLRENIYTDPQKPIQVQPGLYEINNPSPDAPVLVTTNFSITYFSVANEVESAGLPAWLLVTDAEGMSVLTAWAAGKFDAERIAKSVKEFNVTDKVNNRHIVLPGHVATLSGELEEELPDWQVVVGPREAVDLPAFMAQVL